MAETNRGYPYPSDYELEADVPSDIKKLAENIDKDVSNLEKGLKQEISDVPQYDDTKVKEDISSLKQENTKINENILELTDKSGNKLSLEIDTVNYIMTLKLLNQDDVELDSKTIDFPLESVVVNGRYEDGNVILTLQNETEITIPIGEIINGLVSQKNFDSAVKDLQGKIDKCVKTTEFQESQETQNAEITKLQEENEALKKLLPTVTGKGEDVILKGTGEAKFKRFEISGNAIQDEEPSPENKVEIKKCGDNVNLCPTSADGWEQGYIETDTGVANTDKNAIKTKDFIEVIPNENYHIKINNPQVYAFRNCYAYDENKQFVGVINNKLFWLLTESTFTIPENIKYIKFSILNNDSSGDKVTTTDIVPDLKIKMEKGTKASSYSLFGQGCMNIKISDDGDQLQEITVPVQQPMLKGDYFDLEKGKEVHHWKKIVFDGVTNKITKASGIAENDFLQVSYSSTPIPNGEIFCDRLKGQPYGTWLYDKKYGNAIVARNDEIQMKIKYTLFDCTSGMKDHEMITPLNSYLKQNPLEVWYEADELTELDLTKEQKTALQQLSELKTYEGTTHIFSEDEVPPICDVEAYAKIVNASNQVQSELSSEPPTYEEASTEDNQMDEPSFEDTEDEGVIE